MSSTNKTTKLGLSQFLGTDKPAWLGDYNSDMQKIDDAFANLEQDGQSSATDIAALQQKDDELTQDIADVNDRVDAVAGDIISVGNRTTVLEGNYDTIHHELILNNEAIKATNKSIDDMKKFSTEERAVGTWIDGRTIYEKTITYELNESDVITSNTHKSVNTTILAGVTGLVDCIGSVSLFSDTKVLTYPLGTCGINEGTKFVQFTNSVCYLHETGKLMLFSRIDLSTAFTFKSARVIARYLKD